MKNVQVLIVLILMILNSITSYAVALRYNNDSTQIQLPEFAMKSGSSIGVLTLSTGVNVKLDEVSTINTRLPFNTFFMELITEFTRERIPERVVHGKGFGAFGYFEVTDDLSDICEAKVFGSVGKITPTLVRFSPANQRFGGRDTVRDTRGFAIKFYTEEGNFDLLCLDVEMFVMKDPVLFPAFARVLHQNPKTHVMDNNMMWDFFTLRPESVHFQMRLFGDRGIPDGYRYMPGFAIHTFELLNKYGNRTYVKFHILPDAGTKNLTTQQAEKIQAYDTDFANRDLYNAIHDGEFPSWTLYVQTIAYNDIHKAGFDIFDVTKTWPLKKFPLRPVGKLVMNKNPDNQFAAVELAAFDPGHLVNGIRGVDTLFEGRIIAYRDAQNYRLGTNLNKIDVNCPIVSAKTYLRDGVPPVLSNGRESPNYYPNSFNGPLPIEEYTPPRLTVYTDPNPTNFDQACEIYNEMNEGERCRFVDNLLSGLSVATQLIQERAIKLYKRVHIDLGKKLENGLRYSYRYSCPQL